MLALPLPLVALGFIFIFFYGIASGQTSHPLWKASCLAMFMMSVTGFVIYSMISA